MKFTLKHHQRKLAVIIVANHFNISQEMAAKYSDSELNNMLRKIDPNSKLF